MMCLAGCTSDSGSAAREQGSNAPQSGNGTSASGEGGGGNALGGSGGNGGFCASCCPQFTIDSETVATQPADRTRQRIGIGEEVNLSSSPSQSLTWTIEGDDGQKGTLSRASGTTTKYTACDRAKSVTIKGRHDACGKEATLVFTVVQPSRGQFGPKTDINAIGANLVQVGFTATPAWLPADVSFYRCDFREGECEPNVSGIFSRESGDDHDESTDWIPMSTTVGRYGTMMQGSDTVSTRVPRSWMPSGGTTNGRFHWPIPWRCKVRSGGTNGEFVLDTLDHIKSYTAGTRLLKVEKRNRSAEVTVP